jgi:hypothetical protein
MISTPRTDIRIRIEGQTVQFSHQSEAFAFVAGYHNRVRQSAHAVAEARCLLGWALMELAKAFPGHSMEWLCGRCGVHTSMGRSVIELAEVAADPQTGRLSPSMWEQMQTLTAEWCEQNQRGLPTDPDTGEYSVPSILVALGKRNPPKTGGNVARATNPPQQGESEPVPTQAAGSGDADTLYDPLTDALNDLPPPRARGPKPHMMPGYVPPAERPAGCVGATQPELPWHLAESARTLADRAAEFEQAVQRGEVDADYAHSIQARIDGLLTDLAAAKAGAL